MWFTELITLVVTGADWTDSWIYYHDHDGPIIIIYIYIILTFNNNIYYNRCLTTNVITSCTLVV
jgi:hypothetical protein